MKTKNNFNKIALIGLVVLIVLGFGFFMKSKADAPEKAAKAQSMTVQTVKMEAQNTGRSLALSAEARPYQTVTLYAKVSGYLQKIYVDKGQNVKAGQIIATIESPDLEQQRIALNADLKQKQSYLARLESLLAKKYITESEVDKARADVEMAKANLTAQKERLAYTTIKAPFAGIVSARYADVGALMQAATGSQTSSLPVVTISQANRLRITAFIEQNDAALVHPGTPVDIAVNGDTLQAKITRLNGELDEQTRMMLAEVEYDNSNHKIIAGSFLKIFIHLPKQNHLMLPTEALVVKNNQYFAGVIQNNHIFYRPIKIGAGDGILYPVLSGLNAGDEVALNVGNTFIEGSVVKIVNKSDKK